MDVQRWDHSFFQMFLDQRATEQTLNEPGIPVSAQEQRTLPLPPVQPPVQTPRHPDHTLPKYSSHCLPHLELATSSQMLRSTIWESFWSCFFFLYPLHPIHWQVPLGLSQKHIWGMGDRVGVWGYKVSDVTQAKVCVVEYSQYFVVIVNGKQPLKIV